MRTPDQEGAGEALKEGQRGWGVPINIFRFKENKTLSQHKNRLYWTLVSSSLENIKP